LHSKRILDEFSKQVEELRVAKKYETFTDAIEHIIESGVYDDIGITYTNAVQFMNKSLKEKIFLEFSERNMIKKEFIKKVNKLF